MTEANTGSLGIPASVLQEVKQRLGGEAGTDSLRFRQLSGGCIHPAVHVQAGQDGPEAFLKWAPPPAAPFHVEADGLEALAARGGLRVPRVLAVTDHWLLLEYLPPAPPARDTGRRLGAGLARLHRPLSAPGDGGPRVGSPTDPPAGSAPGSASRSASGGPTPPGDRGDSRSPLPGWERDGWIGSLPQQNRGGPEPWPDFWREFRLEPQIARAHRRLPAALRRSLDRLLGRLDEALAGWKQDGSSLLHGDLWSGNVLVTTGGEPALVDPAVYRGHREVDLAMMELFGGFDEDVMAAYREARPLLPGYPHPRRDVYQLYPLLVHVNLFGAGYVDGVRRVVEGALSVVG